MIRDFERGVSRRTICQAYECTMETFEYILRERLRELASTVRRMGVAA
jgi:hypothetical protein